MIPRSEERRGTQWLALIRLADGGEIPCTVRDISKSGAKLGVPSHHALPKTFLFRVIGKDFVCSAKMVWRKGDYVGVAIGQVAKLKPVAPKMDDGAPTPEPFQVIQARRSRFSRH